MPRSKRHRRLLLFVVAFYAVATLVARRRGYRFGTDLVVRCWCGHLFTTIWIPGVSVKSIRFGWWRLQRCPVGDHWSIVSPVREADLSEDERQLARGQRDSRIP